MYGYSEFIDYCLETPQHPNAQENASQRDETGSENPWTGTQTWEEAVKYAKHGWDAGLQDLKDYVETDSTLINVEHSLVGHAVDVGRFLTGVPDTMVSFYDDSYRNKAPITVYTQLTYNAGITGEKAMRYCGKILDTIAILNRTFNVRLVGAFPTKHGKTGRDVVMINIKNTDERFVMNNLAFSYNPSFFRRFWFKWLETTNFWEYGYGSTPPEKFGQGKVGELLQSILPPTEQSLFLPNVYDIEQFDPVAIAKSAVEEQQNRNR